MEKDEIKTRSRWKKKYGLQPLGSRRRTTVWNHALQEGSDGQLSGKIGNKKVEHALGNRNWKANWEKYGGGRTMGETTCGAQHSR